MNSVICGIKLAHRNQLYYYTLAINIPKKLKK